MSEHELVLAEFTEKDLKTALKLFEDRRRIGNLFSILFLLNSLIVCGMAFYSIYFPITKTIAVSCLSLTIASFVVYLNLALKIFYKNEKV